MTRKIRLLHLIDQLGDAGAENLLYTFASGIDRARFDLHICALRPWAPPTIVPRLRALGFPVTELDQHHAYDLPVLRALVRYIRRNHIDLIHTHLLAADIMGRVAGCLTRRPVVSTIHNGRADLDREPVHRRLMERWSARLWCRRLIVVSALLRPEIAAWFGVSRGRVIAIPNGIDTGRYRPRPGIDRAGVQQALVGDRAGTSVRLVTNVARLVPQKGQHVLVDAAAQVMATRPDVAFLLVGDGPLRQAILDQAAARGIGNRLVITGIRSDVPEILAASDVFVLSSLWEGLPLALLEAMAAGCPAVATAVGGVAQVLEQGASGLLVPPDDARALAAAIGACLDDPAGARQRSARASARVEQEYGMQTMTRRWEAVYLRELGRER